MRLTGDPVSELAVAAVRPAPGLSVQADPRGAGDGQDEEKGEFGLSMFVLVIRLDHCKVDEPKPAVGPGVPPRHLLGDQVVVFVCRGA